MGEEAKTLIFRLKRVCSTRKRGEKDEFGSTGLS